MSPDYILFAQHGWADTNRAIAQLADKLATPQTLVISPNLGYLKTWLRIEPLIESVARTAIATVKRYPDTPIRIVGHSMGGLIWLEVLDRYPQLKANVESLVLVASPIGGADIARIIDPLGIGIGIARDLGINRRAIAERIAEEIPTLVIAGDIDNGSDGTITVETTKCDRAHFICVKNISHAALKNHVSLVDIVRDFWASPTVREELEPDFATLIVRRLRSTLGMTDAHPRHLPRAKEQIAFDSGVTIRTWKNLWQIQHIFVCDRAGDCLYSGFVGWQHNRELENAIAEIELEVSRLKQTNS